MYDPFDEQEHHRPGEYYRMISLHDLKGHKLRVVVSRGYDYRQTRAQVEVLAGKSWKVLHFLIGPRIEQVSVSGKPEDALRPAAYADRDRLIKTAETLLVGASK